MPQQLVEQVTITEAQAAAAKKSGRFLMQFISPGWGTSGYYSPEVLEAAAADRVIPKGTHMYADHPHQDGSGLDEHGNRSIKDLMAVVNEDARVAADGALVGEIAVVPAWQPLLDTVYESIGCSIRGGAEVTEGEAEGRSGLIIEALSAPIMSVDFVTRPGRGGKVLQVLESAAANQRALDRGIAEATVNDTREALQTVLREAYGAGENTYVWVRDFDASTVWFEIEGRGAVDAGIYGQAYTSADGVVALSGSRAEVRIQTTYVPVARPGSTTTTTESEEDTMPNIQVDEAEHTRLVEQAGRVSTLESERDTAVAQRDTAIAERDQLRARESAVAHARARVVAANAALPTPVVDRIVAESTRTVPLTDAGALDTTALDTAVDTARTAEESYLAGLTEAAGGGSVFGMGGTSGGGQTAEITESDIDNVVAGAFGRQVKEA